MTSYSCPAETGTRANAPTLRATAVSGDGAGGDGGWGLWGSDQSLSARRVADRSGPATGREERRRSVPVCMRCRAGGRRHPESTGVLRRHRMGNAAVGGWATALRVAGFAGRGAIGVGVVRADESPADVEVALAVQGDDHGHLLSGRVACPLFPRPGKDDMRGARPAGQRTARGSRRRENPLGLTARASLAARGRLWSSRSAAGASPLS